jgi:hypothetical protein
MTKFSDGFPLSPGGLYQPADNSIYVTNATVRVQHPTEGRIAKTIGHTLNTTDKVAVAKYVYWQRIDHETPRGVKLQLLGKGGVATYGLLQGRDTFWTHWAPLPRRAPDDNN